jgi:hypothetical protein
LQFGKEFCSINKSYLDFDLTLDEQSK